MIFKRFLAMAKKGKGGNKLGQRDGRKSWSEIQRDNADWEMYYKAQGLIPEGEFEAFKNACQQPLPLTFRVTGSRAHAKEIAALYKESIMPNLLNVQVEGYKEPSVLPWYPDQLAFQIDIPKNIVKKTPEYKEVQKYLFTENEVGNISRQEAVSMIPPLVLDVEPHHHVLDMCAAPGSKTAQLIESLHTNKDGSVIEEPSGFVMANDSDYKRCYMLVHQIKRLNSSNVVIVNHDSQMFPNMVLEEGGKPVKFDRILCDVPCSGDGTMRKNVMVWKDWKVGNGIGLHRLQLNILKRGLQMLKPGGRLVYSTCSTNPIENEAVVAAALKANPNIRTVECADRLPGLVRHKGVSDWKVFGKDLKLRERGATDMLESIFPPTEEESKDYHLENCMRVYPHDQNTGGFFITCLEKLPEEPEQGIKREASESIEQDEAKKQKVESSATPVVEGTPAPADHVKQNKKKLPRDANEEPFKFLTADNEAVVKCIDFYGINDNFPRDSMLVRNSTGEATSSIYFVAPVVKNLLKFNDQKFKFVYTGIKMFISQKVDRCPWRISNDGLSTLKSYLPESRQITSNLEGFKQMLLNDRAPIANVADADPEFDNKVNQMRDHAFFVKVERGEGKEDMLYPVWKGEHCYNLMVNKHECAEILYRIYGIDKAVLDKEKADLKAKADAEKAAETAETAEAEVAEK